MPVRESHIAVKKNTPELHKSIQINPISTLLIRWKQFTSEHLQYDSLMNIPHTKKVKEIKKKKRIWVNDQV